MPFIGGAVCEACPAGTFQADSAGVVCTACPVGFYQPNLASIECLPCACDDGDPNTSDPCDLVTGACLTPVAVDDHAWGMLKVRYNESE